MKNLCKVLLIDDHPIIVEAYTNALLKSISHDVKLQFDIESAYDCHNAYEKIFNTSSIKPFDIIVLDISLPPSEKYKIFSGIDLGLQIKNKIPLTKIMVITHYNDALRLNNILHNLDPEGFLIKSDIMCNDFVNAFRSIREGGTFYTETIRKLIRKTNSRNLHLDAIDIKILYEISNGAKMKELLELIPLGKSAIEKRRRMIKENFADRNMSDRTMILKAKEKGFI